MAASSFSIAPCSTASRGDDVAFEGAPLEGLARDRQLMAFPHDGFWRPMDTLRDKTQLEELWQQNRAPWKIWA